MCATTHCVYVFLSLFFCRCHHIARSRTCSTANHCSQLNHAGLHGTGCRQSWRCCGRLLLSVVDWKHFLWTLPMDSGKQTDGCFVMGLRSPSGGRSTNDSVTVTVTDIACRWEELLNFPAFISQLYGSTVTMHDGLSALNGNGRVHNGDANGIIRNVSDWINATTAIIEAVRTDVRTANLSILTVVAVCSLAAELRLTHARSGAFAIVKFVSIRGCVLRRFVYLLWYPKGRLPNDGGWRRRRSLQRRRCDRVAVELKFNAQFTPPARHDKTVLSVSCLAVWIESRDRLAKTEQLADRSPSSRDV